MRIAYYTTSPAPALRGTDAVHNDIARLQSFVPGWHTSLYPFRKPGRWRGRKWYGLQQLPRLLWLDRRCDVHHVFSGGVTPIAVLRLLRRPVIRTLAAGLCDDEAVDAASIGRDWVVVSSSRDAARLQAAGLKRVSVIRPGIDVERIQVAPAPAEPFTLLCASAPWIESQIQTKGFDVMLDAVASLGDIHLLLVLRGFAGDALRRRIDMRGLNARVEVIDAQVDINAALRRCHAAFALAARPNLIRAYPHSLLEAIAASRPVILSRCIPMSDDVESQHFGQVCDDLSLDNVCSAIRRLRGRYVYHALACTSQGRVFANDANSLRAHLALYEQLAQAHCGSERAHAV